MNRGEPEWDVPTSVESSNIHDNFSQLWSKLIICCTITITIVIEANSTVAPSCNPNWSGIIQYTWQLLTIVIQGLTICSNVQFIYADHISSVSRDSLLEKRAGKWLLLIIGYWEHPMPRTIHTAQKKTCITDFKRIVCVEDITPIEKFSKGGIIMKQKWCQAERK